MYSFLGLKNRDIIDYNGQIIYKITYYHFYIAYLTDMNILRSWREQKVMLKQRFSILCDEDFEFQEGEKEEMFDRLSHKLEKTREELKLLFAELQTY